ncbi:MAG: 2-oxo-4-hydroxy-4-carboxy-5-ureidoimidazoline decarboxylase [Planctomycetota bacterium]|jgi:2-oxo-4-hydroxy-4-carboxy-5-ureidoimidazoline decarboxylase
MKTATTIDSINHLDLPRFVELLGGIYEHSPWVAETVFQQKPFADAEQLLRAMAQCVGAADDSQRRKLLCSHPQLAGREAQAGTLTRASQSEQSSAGLNQCSAQELAHIKQLNQRYQENFTFPFIIAVTGLNKFQIIAVMEARLTNPVGTEFNTALSEVDKIAAIRLNALIDG